MPRALWKGSISFGLVNIPVSLYPASTSHRLDLDWIDKRDMSPVGYKRVSKTSGKEVPREAIVHGYEYEKGRYVVLGDDEIRAASPEMTQSVDILAFVPARDIGFLYLESPYFLVPEKGGARAYGLLRTALAHSGKLGVARVVMHTRQHLAALVPCASALVLNTLRWSDQMRDAADVGLPDDIAEPPDKKTLAMALRLIDDMTERWHPDAYRDTFQDELMAMIEHKIETGRTRDIAPAELPHGRPRGENVVDLVALLKRSLGGHRDKGGARGQEDNVDKGRGGKSTGTHKAARQRKRA